MTLVDFADAIARLEAEQVALNARIAELEPVEQQLADARLRLAGVAAALAILQEGSTLA